MKKVYVLLAEGFELLEATTPIDILKRAKIKVVTLSLSKEIFVKSAQNVIIKADEMFRDYKDGDCLILPGGYSLYENLFRSDEATKFIKFYLDNKKIVVGISNTPIFLAKKNLINNKTVTLYYPDDPLVKEKCKILNEDIVQDGNLITVSGTGHMEDLSFLLLKCLASDKVSDVKKGMKI